MDDVELVLTVRNISLENIPGMFYGISGDLAGQTFGRWFPVVCAE